MLQALNILENVDLKAMGYNSPRYIHTVYQAISMAFADRDFYYGDPSFPPEEPVAGLLSKEYARERLAGMRLDRNDPDVRPGDPYPFQGGSNPFKALLDAWRTLPGKDTGLPPQDRASLGPRADPATEIGTTSVIAADAEGWVVSMTPAARGTRRSSPAAPASASSQRMQAFVLEASDNPYNVLVPGKQPRVTLTPDAHAAWTGSPSSPRRSRAPTRRTRTCSSSS